ncbi:MAG TPA: polysaccharide biosynthesis/export family protein [Candidatus Acidoferrum sp.]|nr:polysaccharide biosynthesis/export family protein [Candidatus Acidoferrum sp.]
MKHLLLGLICLACLVASAAEKKIAAVATNDVNGARPDYVLVPSDIVQVKVYQEDDLDAKVRLAKDGTVTLPLLGAVNIGGKTREQAAAAIKARLGEKYLVNPQVTVEIVEYSKRRFTVLGQVQRPGTYEFPGDESVNLLQGISMAGGYTRLGAANRITVQRGEGRDKNIFKLDADSMAKEKNVTMFEIAPDDTITVGEKIF